MLSYYFKSIKNTERKTQKFQGEGESLYSQFWDANNLYGWAMPQKLPVNNFERIRDTSKFNENFIQKYKEKVVKGISLKLLFVI